MSEIKFKENLQVDASISFKWGSCTLLKKTLTEISCKGWGGGGVAPACRKLYCVNGLQRHPKFLYTLFTFMAPEKATGPLQKAACHVLCTIGPSERGEFFKRAFFNTGAQCWGPLTPLLGPDAMPADGHAVTQWVHWPLSQMLD